MTFTHYSPDHELDPAWFRHGWERCLHCGLHIRKPTDRDYWSRCECETPMRVSDLKPGETYP